MNNPRYASQIRYIPWTPVLYDTTGVAVTLGTGSTATGEYNVKGEEVSGWFGFVLGTSPNVANAGILTVSLPIPPAVTPTGRFPTALAAIPVGAGYYNDASSESGLGENSHYPLVSALSFSASRVLMVLGPHTGTWGYVSDVDPVGYAAGDKIVCRFTYPRAR